jgi:hypothetical protein
MAVIFEEAIPLVLLILAYLEHEPLLQCLNIADRMVSPHAMLFTTLTPFPRGFQVSRNTCKL